MYFFAPYLSAHPQRARLVAVTDHQPARLHSAVAELGGALRAYDRPEALLQDPAVDAVILATPDATHRQLFDQAVAAGKHVLCEKPLATTLDDALHMARRALAVPHVVQIGFTLRYAPFFVKLKELVDANVIGPLRQVSAVEVDAYYHGASFFRRWHRWRQHSGGLLVHKACHTLDIVNWLVDSVPVWVSARGSTETFIPKPDAASHCHLCTLMATCPAAYRAEQYHYTYQTPAEHANPIAFGADLCVYNTDKDSIDNAALLAQYANGASLSFTFSTTGQRHDRHFILFGQQGQIRASQADGTIVIEAVGAAPQTIVFPEDLRDEHGGGDAPLLDAFLTCVATGQRPLADVLAGLYSVALGIAATQSLDQGGVAVDLQALLADFPTGS